MEITINDFPIGQKIGAIWQINNNEETKYRLEVGKVSSINITKNGTKIRCASVFRRPIEIDEFEDVRNFKKGNLIMVDTPLILPDETIDYFDKIVEHWNKNGANSLFDTD